MKKGKILKLKLGYNPNSSSVGAYIGIFLWSMLITGIIVNAVASVITLRFRRFYSKGENKKDE